jgi:hypothetical protein
MTADTASVCTRVDCSGGFLSSLLCSLVAACGFDAMFGLGPGLERSECAIVLRTTSHGDDFYEKKALEQLEQPV